MTSEDLSEIVELLREIRDLQATHNKRYQEFTDRVLASDERARESAAQAEAEQNAYFEAQQSYQEEMRQAIRTSQRNAILGLVVIVGFLLLLAFGYVALNLVAPNTLTQP